MAIRWWPEPGAQRRPIGRAVLMGLFWVWGAFGLIGNLLSLNSEIGVAALSSQLLWIGVPMAPGLAARTPKLETAPFPNTPLAFVRSASEGQTWRRS
jgi:hypothetical protein